MSARPLDRRQALAAGGSVLLGIAVTNQTIAKPKGKIRVLIIDGVSNHDWKLTTRLIRAILEPTGLFEVEVSTSPPTKEAGWTDWRPAFSAYDAVIQTYNNLKGGPAWPEDVKSDFEAYVKSGGGVYVFHSGNNSFVSWPAYNEMLGLAWRPKEYGTAVYIDDHERMASIPPGEGAGTGHGPRSDAVVHKLGDHPVHKDFPRAWKTADVELYRYARGPAHHLSVHSYAFEPNTLKNWPMEWSVKYGRGRVYVANYGHVSGNGSQPLTMRSADVQTILVRALQWVAKRPVTYPVPADFPTTETTSVRPEFVLE